MESAVLLLEPRHEVVTQEIKRDYVSFSGWVRVLFQKRRKQIGGILKSFLGQDATDKVLTLRELDASLRPENLALEDIRFLSSLFPFNNG